MAFRIVGRRTLAAAAHLSIEHLDVAGPDEDVHERVVVHHPGAVVVVPIEDDRRHVLLVRQYRAAVDGELLEVPAGKRDVAGESPESTARRELAEEIGHEPRELVLLAEFYNSPGFCDEYTYLYGAVGLVPLPQRSAQTAEEREMQIERVALAQVDRMIAARDIVDAKTIIGLMLAREHLGSLSESAGSSPA
jgi:8-oxo-dGTP pyrophosphatase MutT (NUDIX family)